MKCRKPLYSHGLRALLHQLICKECFQHRELDRPVARVVRKMRVIAPASAPRELIDGLPHFPKASLHRRSSAGPISIFAFASVATIFAMLWYRSGARPETSSTTWVPVTDTSKITAHNTERNHPLPNSDLTGRDFKRWPAPQKKGSLARNVEAARPDPSSRIDDTNFLNPGKNGVVVAVRNDLQAPVVVAQSQIMRDDFVEPPPVLLASNCDPGADQAMTAELHLAFEKELQITDAKLYKPVSLALKHATMSELCSELSRQTGEPIYCGHNVADDNITIYIGSRPAREIMREVSRVFGFTWERSGKDGAYRYMLKQDVAAQVAEERLRSNDLEAEFKGIVQQMRGEPGPANERATIVKQVFSGLSRQDIDVLRSGAEVRFRTEASEDAAPLEPDVARLLIATFGGCVKQFGLWMSDPSPEAFPFSKTTDQTCFVGFHETIGEFGGLNIEGSVGVTGKFPDGQVSGKGATEHLGNGVGVAERNVNNAANNIDLKRAPGMQDTVNLDPKPPLAVFEQGHPYVSESLDASVGTIGPELLASYRFERKLQPPRPWMTSDDFWQAVHEATNRDIIADSFSRLFAQKPYQMDLYDALSAACDDMHYRWRLDEGFLTGRSEAYHWQRQNEVPKHLLLKWQKIQKTNGRLSLDQVVEMANLSDRQLNAAEVGKAIYHLWQLPEWGVCSRPTWTVQAQRVRAVARFVGALNTEQLVLLKSGELRAKDVSSELLRSVEYHEIPPESTIRVEYIPPFKYYWRNYFFTNPEPAVDDLIMADSAEGVISELAKRFPGQDKNPWGLTTGHLGLTINTGKDRDHPGDF